MFPRFAAVRRVFVAVALLAPAGAPEGAGADSRPSVFTRPLNSFDAGAVGRAKAGAAKKLQSAECLKVLATYKDQAGRTLEQNLEAWGVSAASYMQSLPFRDGASMPGCQKRTIQMVTSVGKGPVYVCPAGVGIPKSRFAQIQAESPSLAESMVIHEMLHTLGLGENPPSTFEITAYVAERCH